MSMGWMRMPGQTWPAVALSFLGMWILMMAAMMLPSLAPALWRYRHAVAECSGARPAGLAAIVGTGYFSVWTVIGLAIFPVGAALMEVEMRLPLVARAAPAAVGVVVLLAGALQFTAWKARHLACSRGSPARRGSLRPDAVVAWQYGLRLGLHCSYCCAGMTAILLVTGCMELRTMLLLTAAIALERLAPDGQRVARAIGSVAVVTGVLLIARPAGLGG